MVDTQARAEKPVIEERGFRAPGTTHMIAGSLLGAVGAYLFQVLGGRALGTEGFAPIAALWTVFFILATIVIVPLEQYLTREAARGRRVLTDDRRLIGAVAGLGALVGAGFVIVTRDRLFEGNGTFALQIALLMVGYTVMLTAKGLLAGHRIFRGVGAVLVWEAVIRLAAGVAILAVVRSATALAWAMVLAPLAAFPTRFWRYDRPSADVSPTGAGGFLGSYIGGSAASQMLLAGAPLAVAALGGSAATVSVVFVTFTLYRGPLTLIYSLQGRILPYLVAMTTDDARGLRRMARWVVIGGGALTALGGLVGWLIGPEVVGLLFGEKFEPDRLAAAAAAAGVVAASTAQVAGQVLVAAGRTGRLAVAWVVGLSVAALAAVLIPLSPQRAVAVAFVIGEVAAAMTVAILTLRTQRTSGSLV